MDDSTVSSHFNNTFNIISSSQGSLEDIEGKQDHFMYDGMVNGTKFVWFTFPDRDESDEPGMMGANDVIRTIRRYYRLSGRYGCMDADVEEEIMDLGKYYNHYLQGLHPVSITYGGVPVDGKNILQSDEGKTVRESVYEVSIARDTSSQLEYRIRDDSGIFVNSTRAPQNLSVMNKHALGIMVFRKLSCVFTILIRQMILLKTRHGLWIVRCG